MSLLNLHECHNTDDKYDLSDREDTNSLKGIKDKPFHYASKHSSILHHLRRLYEHTPVASQLLDMSYSTSLASVPYTIVLARHRLAPVTGSGIYSKALRRSITADIQKVHQHMVPL